MNTLTIVPSGSWNPRDFFKIFPNKKEKKEKVTLHEDRKNYLVVADFPGFIKDEINISFKNGVLNIYASSYVGSRTLHPHFFGKRNFHRAVHLRGDVDESQIRYLYERNILKIWLPKKARKKQSFGLFFRWKFLRK